MYLILTNPTSGGGKGKETGRRVLDYFQSRSLEYRDISGSSYESSASALARSLAEVKNPEAVVIVGGDGMVHLAIQSLAKSEIPMILVPAGTGNDLARSLRLPLDAPEMILDRCLSQGTVDIDLGVVNGRYFADILSTGFDSVVNERANRMRLISGPMKYNLAIALELPLFKALNYHFRLDDEVIEKKAMLIAIANGRCYGGGMKICPDAELDDGLFDVMILEPVSKVEFLRVFPKVFKGTHVSHPKVSIRRAQRVEINAEAVAYADGERIGALPIRAEILPRALRTWRF